MLCLDAGGAERFRLCPRTATLLTRWVGMAVSGDAPYSGRVGTATPRIKWSRSAWRLVPVHVTTLHWVRQ